MGQRLSKWEIEQRKHVVEHKRKVQEYHAYMKELKSIPTKLLDSGDAMYTDRVGNILNRGDMICYVAGNTLKVGVFVGLIERILNSQINNASQSFWNLAQRPVVTPTKQLAFAILDVKGRARMICSNFDEKNLDGQQFKRYVVIQKPEFKVSEQDIGRCFSLIDDLKDGILKDHYANLNESEDEED